jgi:spermidine synthase
MFKKITMVSLWLWLVLAGLTGIAQSESILHTEHSLYAAITVFENNGTRCLRFNSQTDTQQSCYSLQNPETIIFECNKMMLGSLYLRPNPRRILMIGLGGGTMASALNRILPDARLDVVELDPAMVRVAKEYFSFRPNAKTRVVEQDGRVFVKRAIERGDKYDLVILDAFDQVYIPSHMLTQQFLNEVKNILAPDGVLTANTYSYSRRYDNESATYQSVYGDFFNLKKFWRNTRVIIVKLDGLPSKEVLARNSLLLQDKLQPLGVEASWLLPRFSTDRDWDENARILTDKYLPF